MTRLVGEMILLALGVMVSPTSIGLVILMLKGRRGATAPMAFVAGRVVALFLVVFTLLLFFRSVDFSSASTPSRASALFKVGVGALLLLLGLVIALRKSSGEEAGWLRRRIGSIDRLSPPAACGLGLGLIILSPRFLFLTLAAAATILHADVSVPDGMAALAVFVLVSNLGVLAPLVIYAWSPRESQDVLDAAQGWMTRHQRALVLTVLAVLGSYLVLRGMLDLAG